MSIVIDSTTYNIPFKVINRKADILYKFAERTEDGTLHLEIIGVYYNYDLEMGMSANNVTDYANLWIKLSEAVNSHTITILGDTFSCYFANIKDQQSRSGFFRNLSFSVIAISPAVTP